MKVKNLVWGIIAWSIIVSQIYVSAIAISTVFVSKWKIYMLEHLTVENKREFIIMNNRCQDDLAYHLHIERKET